MKKYIILLTVILASAPVFSQSDTDFDKWFITVGGGINYSTDGVLSNEDGKGTTPALTASIGRWFGPSVGLKLGYDGPRLKNDRHFPDGVDYYSLTVSALWNMTMPERRINFIPYIFAGMAYANEKCFTAGFGLSLPLALGKSLRIVPDIKIATLDDKIYTSVHGGTNAVIEGTLGLRYSF